MLSLGVESFLVLRLRFGSGFKVMECVDSGFEVEWIWTGLDRTGFELGNTKPIGYSEVGGPLC